MSHLNVWSLHGVGGAPPEQLQHGGGHVPASQSAHEHPSVVQAQCLQPVSSHKVPHGDPNVWTYPGVNTEPDSVSPCGYDPMAVQSVWFSGTGFLQRTPGGHADGQSFFTIDIAGRIPDAHSAGDTAFVDMHVAVPPRFTDPTGADTCWNTQYRNLGL